MQAINCFKPFKFLSSCPSFELLLFLGIIKRQNSFRFW